MVQFENSNYILVGISKDSHPNQLQPMRQPSTFKTICVKGGFYISNMNILDISAVKTFGASGNDFHILPRDYDMKKYMANKCLCFQPPGPDNQIIIIQMPFRRCLGESIEVVFLCGNVVNQTELEIMFPSVPEHIQPLEKSNTF
ncbi:unnamed protein product [Hymenolepis diminuta]|uniref:Uncharacterized protein n=1 Tax=Hymenolepis diminuta TaxID=6216 RepID=A0A564YB36_HYMDI|nr:unnamed protein product [Hymenolepis diminuta]